LADTSGTVVERFAYQGYGTPKVLDPNWSDDLNNQSDFGWETLFAGYRYDADTGLYHVRNRYYHAQLGRWLTRDPLGYVDGMSLYEYVRSSPVDLLDPFGLENQTFGTDFFGDILLPDPVDSFEASQAGAAQLGDAIFNPCFPGDGFDRTIAGIGGAADWIGNGIAAITDLIPGKSALTKGLKKGLTKLTGNAATNAAKRNADDAAVAAAAAAAKKKADDAAEAAAQKADDTARTSSKWEDATAKGAKEPNTRTDLTKSEFEDNLRANGFEGTPSPDGKVTNFTKEGSNKTFTTRGSDASNHGPTVDVKVDGEITHKIRVEE